MIKELGTLGFYIKFNESASAALKVVEVFSSSAAATSLFVASTNSSKILFRSNSASCYINGLLSASLVDNQWQHVTITFTPKLSTNDENNFLIRFGDTAKANFNIQNLYSMKNTMTQSSVDYIHKEFTGFGSNASAGYSASKSISFIDKIETRHSSSVTGNVYLPYQNQNRFIGDVAVTASQSLSIYTSSVLAYRLSYFDGYQVTPGDLILSLADNQIYRLNNNGLLSTVSSSNGDYIKTIGGAQFEDCVFVKTSGSFSISPFIEKISYILDN